MAKYKKPIARWTTRIWHYMNDNHGYSYINIPKKNILIKDITELLNKIGDTSIINSFINCNSPNDKLELFYNYITSSNYNRPYNKSKKNTDRSINPNWVDYKISKLNGDEKWKAIRYQALKAGNGKCVLCGMSASDGIKLHVDHIKPKSIYPELMYDLDNLQILCEPCNIGKCNYDDTDWRHGDDKECKNTKPKIYLIKNKLSKEIE